MLKKWYHKIFKSKGINKPKLIAEALDYLRKDNYYFKNLQYRLDCAYNTSEITKDDIQKAVKEVNKKPKYLIMNKKTCDNLCNNKIEYAKIATFLDQTEIKIEISEFLSDGLYVVGYDDFYNYWENIKLGM